MTNEQKKLEIAKLIIAFFARYARNLPDETKRVWALELMRFEPFDLERGMRGARNNSPDIMSTLDSLIATVRAGIATRIREKEEREYNKGKDKSMKEIFDGATGISEKCKTECRRIWLKKNYKENDTLESINKKLDDSYMSREVWGNITEQDITACQGSKNYGR